MLDMEKPFIGVLNMSVTATYAILFVLLGRLLLRKAPRIFSYSLWGVVLFRLVCPYSFASAFSLLKSIFPSNGKAEHIPMNLGLMARPQVDMGIDGVSQIINSSLPAATPYASINPMQFILALASLVWVFGGIVLLSYGMASYIMLKRQVREAILVGDRIFECGNIQTPFVLGLIRPKIYLPQGLSESEKIYILKHERTHIKRRDHVIKPLAFLVLCIHWFNPLVWLSFILMSRDMEMSCDENVLKELGNEIKREYSTSLLSMAIGRRLVSGSPLAFGESNVKKRIKNVLNYKRPSFLIIAVAATIVVAVGVGIMSNPRAEKSEWESKAQSYLGYRTEYVGDASKVGGIIRMLPFPKDVSYDHFELQTASEPYGITIHLKTAEGMVDTAMVSDHMRYQKNSLLLFSLIGNLGEIVYRLSDGSESNTILFARAWADNIMKTEVWKASESQGEYEEFLKRLEAAFPEPEDVSAEADKNPEVLVEGSLDTIMSSPLSSSNPNDYISAHQREYENILKHGGQDALDYMLGQFQKGSVKNDLRGQIMMRLCKDLLGPKNNVTDESLLPLEWYSELELKEQTLLTDFAYQGDDDILKLVYHTETEKNQWMKRDGGFLVVAPHVHGSYKEGNILKVFVTTYASAYVLYGKQVTEISGSIVPVAITYMEKADGSYALAEYRQSQDGSYWAPSIRKFSTLPVSGKEIKGLADKIMEHYSNYEDILKLNTENLKAHLKLNGRMDVQQKENGGTLVPLT